MQNVTPSAPLASPNRVALLVTAWLALGAGIALITPLDEVPQLAPAFVICSSIGWALAYWRRGQIREWVDALPMRAVIAGHALRLPIGAVFLWEAARGQLTEMFAQRAGWGDIVAGAAALLVALFAWQSRRLVRAFALFGLVDILVALGTTMYLLFVARDPLMLEAITRQPYPLLPLGVVPVVIVTHLWMLARTRRPGR